MTTKNHKIIFTGPVGAGKTTAISSISDIDPVITDAIASDMTTARKTTTTVAMDYGLMTLDEKTRVHLYGTPGQERFGFMWDILTEGGLGLVLLLDNKAKDPLGDMKFYLNAFSDFIKKSGVVIGITRMDLERSPTLNHYRESLDKLNVRAPLLEVDARDSDDVSRLVQALLYSLDPGAQ